MVKYLYRPAEAAVSIIDEECQPYEQYGRFRVVHHFDEHWMLEFIDKEGGEHEIGSYEDRDLTITPFRRSDVNKPHFWFRCKIKFDLRAYVPQYRNYLCINFRYPGCTKTKEVSLWYHYDPDGALTWFNQDLPEYPPTFVAICQTCAGTGPGSPQNNWSVQLPLHEALPDDAVCRGCKQQWKDLDPLHECPLNPEWYGTFEDGYWDPELE